MNNLDHILKLRMKPVQIEGTTGLRVRKFTNSHPCWCVLRANGSGAYDELVRFRTNLVTNRYSWLQEIEDHVQAKSPKN